MRRQPARRFLLAASVAGLLLRVAPAAAGEPAVAEALFEQARALRDSGAYGEACPKFEESQRLDPGMGTLYNLADCFEHIGRNASAWAAFIEVAELAAASGQAERAQDARGRASAAEGRLARVTVRVAVAIPSLRVVRDQVEVGPTQWGIALPMDSGEHAIAASAPGKRTWATKFTVPPDTSNVEVVVPELEDAPPPAPAPGTQPAQLKHADPPRDLGSVKDEGNLQRTVGLVLAGAGVVGIGVGTVFGIVALSKHSSAKDHCGSNNVCSDAEGVSLLDSAVNAGAISTVAWIAGGGLLLGGGILWLTAPRPSHAPATGLRVAPLLGQGLSGVRIEGRWQ